MRDENHDLSRHIPDSQGQNGKEFRLTRIVFLDRATIAPDIHIPPPRFAHEWINYEISTPEETQARLSDAEIAITNKVKIDANALDAAPRLRLVAIAATGHDCVDLAACQERGVTVCNIRGYSVNTVPEHVFALLLALRRSVIPYVEEVKKGAWQKAGQFCFFSHPIHDLAGSTMGIVGKGSLGAKVADLATAFGMDVIFAAREDHQVSAGRLKFEDFCAQADVISLHCPLTDTTRSLLGPAAFAAMKRRPIIINTARGALIDLPALRDALQRGQIAGAGIDVSESEPPLPDDILMQLASDPRVLVTPHVAWASSEAQNALAYQLRDILEAFQQGQSINRLT